MASKNGFSIYTHSDRIVVVFPTGDKKGGRRYMIEEDGSIHEWKGNKKIGRWEKIR